MEHEDDIGLRVHDKAHNRILVRIIRSGLRLYIEKRHGIRPEEIIPFHFRNEALAYLSRQQRIGKRLAGIGINHGYAFSRKVETGLRRFAPLHDETV